MDQALVDLLGSVPRTDESEIRFHSGAPDSDEIQIEIEGPAGPTRYALKPLRELYGKGQGGPSVNPQDERYQPVFLSIETESDTWQSQ